MLSIIVWTIYLQDLARNDKDKLYVFQWELIVLLLLQICFCYGVRDTSCCLCQTITKLHIQIFRLLTYIDNPYFEQMVGQINPTELQLNKANYSDTEAPVLDYLYHKLRKTFSKFYRRYYDLISKFQVGLKSLLRQGLSETDFYGDLVYKLKKIVGSNNFSAHFIKIISHYKKIGYNINVLQQTACLVVNPITVGNYAFLFNCTPAGQTSDSMMVPTQRLIFD